MTNRVTITKDLTPQIKAALKSLSRDRVLVGIPAEKAARDPDPDDPHPEINNAEIGYLNEFGVPEKNIPARPHLVPGVRDAAPAIAKIYQGAFAQACAGNAQGVSAAHEVVGNLAASSVKKRITGSIAPPLAERTLKARQARGRTGETPLLDTGAYLRNIDFVVVSAANVKKVT